MDSATLFDPLKKTARGLNLARDGPLEILHKGLAFQNGCVLATALRDEYFRLAEAARNAGKARPHRHARDTLIARVGDTKYNLGVLLAWCFRSGPIMEDSTPTDKELCLQ